MTEQEWLACTDPAPMLEFLRVKASDRKLRLFGAACCRRVEYLLPTDRLRQLLTMIEQRADELVSSQTLDDVVRDEHLADPPMLEAVAEVRDAVLAAGELPADWVQGWMPSGYDLWPVLRTPLPEPALPVAVQIAANHSAWAQAWGADPEHLEHACDDLMGRLGVRVAEWRDELRAGLKRMGGDSVWAVVYRVAEQTQSDLARCIFGNPFRAPTSIDPSWLRWNDGTVRRIAQAIYDERVFERMGILADALLDAGCDNDELLAHCREQEGVHASGCWVLDLLLNKE